jgi:muramoyltetrapeptide carboxypeptidase
MINKKILKRGKAFLVATSGFAEEKNLILAKKRAKELGFKKLLINKEILKRYFSYAGEHFHRYNELNKAYISDAEVIFNVIGGMGAVHLLPYLDYDLIKKSNKTLVGYSDLTIILNYISEKTKARSLHGPHLGIDKEISQLSLDYLNKALDKIDYDVSFEEKDVLKGGYAKSTIVGGNLELIGRSLGTPYEIQTDGKMLFLEDYDMKSWRVLDILWQLKLAGKFDKINGLIMGYFTKCGDEVLTYIKDFLKDFNFPIIYNQKIGHEEPNITIPLGEICYIDTLNKKWGIKFR